MEGNKIGFLQATDGIYNVDIGVIVNIYVVNSVCRLQETDRRNLQRRY